MNMKPHLSVLASVVFVVMGIFSSMALGWWQTESDKTPQRLDI